MPLRKELFPSLLSCEGAFSGVVDSLIQETFPGDKPQTPNLTWYYYETNKLNIVLLEKSLKTKIYPLWRNIHIHMSALRRSFAPVCLGNAQASLGKEGIMLPDDLHYGSQMQASINDFLFAV